MSETGSKIGRLLRRCSAVNARDVDVPTPFPFQPAAKFIREPYACISSYEFYTNDQRQSGAALDSTLVLFQLIRPSLRAKKKRFPLEAPWCL